MYLDRCILDPMSLFVCLLPLKKSKFEKCVFSGRARRKRDASSFPRILASLPGYAALIH